jgi:hypothetical protein
VRAGQQLLNEANYNAGHRYFAFSKDDSTRADASKITPELLAASFDVEELVVSSQLKSRLLAVEYETR